MHSSFDTDIDIFQPRRRYFGHHFLNDFLDDLKRSQVVRFLTIRNSATHPQTTNFLSLTLKE